MRFRDAVALHIGFWAYLIGGGGMFYWLETDAHNNLTNTGSPAIPANFCQSLMDTVNRSLTADGNFSEDVTPRWYRMISQTCLNVSSAEDSSASLPTNLWDFSEALFLAMTILTTIGYGNPVTITKSGKVFAVIYGFFGIPLGGILLASTSDYFGNYLLTVYNNQRKEHNEKIAITVASAVFLIPGLLLFIFIPAAIFTVIEQWSYLDAFFYSFVTLTTIGFGDVVAAHQGDSNWLVVYRVAVILWIIIGISYWAVIIAFVTKALKSKKLRRQWLKTTESIAHHVDELKNTIDKMSHEDGFVAHKSKNAFQFALQVAGTVGQFGPDLGHQLSIPGIATALHPQAKGRYGIHSLFEMSIKMIGHSRLAENLNPSTPDVPAEKIPRPPLISQISEDSGLGLQLPNSPPNNFHKTKSTLSLPAPSTIPAWPLPSKVLLKRTQTRPELLHSDSQDRLKNLLIQAALILQEAQATGTSLSCP